jgi:hypothetical protein
LYFKKIIYTFDKNLYMEIEKILDKVIENGIDSLTQEEKQRLENYDRPKIDIKSNISNPIVKIFITELRHILVGSAEEVWDELLTNDFKKSIIVQFGGDSKLTKFKELTGETQLYFNGMMEDFIEVFTDSMSISFNDGFNLPDKSVVTKNCDFTNFKKKYNLTDEDIQNNFANLV